MACLTITRALRSRRRLASRISCEIQQFLIAIEGNVWQQSSYFTANSPQKLCNPESLYNLKTFPPSALSFASNFSSGAESTSTSDHRPNQTVLEESRERVKKVVDNFLGSTTKPQRENFNEVINVKDFIFNEEDEVAEAEIAVPVEDQKSLVIGIVGAPNSGKSVLTNALVGGKVSIVSRKTNTTRKQILGVATKGDTQLLIYDTPGATRELKAQTLKPANKAMATMAWNVINDCHLLLLLIDADRQIRRPDPRVTWLAEKLGQEGAPNQTRIACLNKVDLVKEKRSLIPLADWLQGLGAFERVFMISGLRGGGVRALEEFLHSKAKLQPWEEHPHTTCTLPEQEMTLELVRETILDRLHQELPYTVEQELVSWKHLRDGTVRVEIAVLVETDVQRAMVVGRGGDTIRYIGTVARAKLEHHFKQRMHLVLNVKICKS